MAKQLTSSTKPRIKKVSVYECYLVDERGRKKRRICGTQRNRMPEGYVCTNNAGRGTDHPGIGPCEFHDRQISNPRNTGLWLRLNKEAGLPSNLLEFLESAEDIEETHLVNVDDDIKNLYALQAVVLSSRKASEDGEDGVLYSKDIDLLMSITDKILKAKALRVKLNKEMSLDITTIKLFVNQIFKIIVAETAETVSRRILTAIVDGVIVPFRTQGRIKGGAFEYDPETQEIVDTEFEDIAEKE